MGEKGGGGRRKRENLISGLVLYTVCAQQGRAEGPELTLLLCYSSGSLQTLPCDLITYFRCGFIILSEKGRAGLQADAFYVR